MKKGDIIKHVDLGDKFYLVFDVTDSYPLIKFERIVENDYWTYEKYRKRKNEQRNSISFW